MIFNLEVFNFPSLTLNQSLEGLEQVWEQALSAGDKLKKDWTKKEDHNTLETFQYLAKQGSNALKMLGTIAGQNAQWSGKTCLGLSADGSLIVCGHQLGKLRLYDAKTGKLIWTYKRHDGEVNSLCISQDKKLILSGGADKTLKVWEIGKHESIRALRQGDCLATFTGHDAAVLSVCLRRDNQFALSGSADHTLRLWQVATGNCIKILTGHTNAVKVVCLDFTGKFAVSASADTTLRYWDLETGACLKVLTGHTAAINCLALSLDGQLLLSGSQDQTARIWNLRTGECLQILEGHRLEITTVALSINNQWAITGDSEQIKVWFLNWELGDSLAQVREGGFSQYLEMFLQEHTPYARSLPDNRKVTPDEITESLMQRGVPIWTDQDLQNLLHILSYVGCGSTGVLTELQQRRNNLILPLLKAAGQRTNYQQLVALLEQNLWQAANEETARIIRSVVNSAPGRNIDLHLWQSFPAADLLILDLLWVHYSQGRFGFSVQKTIFQEVGFQATKQWDRVGDRLGWRLQEKWLFDQDINFTLQAPQGHLPILGTSLNLPVWWFRRTVYLYLISSSAWQSLDTKSYTALNLEEIIG
jgi:hypothetical protein